MQMLQAKVDLQVIACFLFESFFNLTFYPCESFREGLCNQRRTFVCLKRGQIWTKFFGKVPRGKSKPKFVSGYDH